MKDCESCKLGKPTEETQYYKRFKAECWICYYNNLSDFPGHLRRDVSTKEEETSGMSKMKWYEMGDRAEERVIPPETKKERVIQFIMLYGATREEAEDFAECFNFENERTERGE